MRFAWVFLAFLLWTTLVSSKKTWLKCDEDLNKQIQKASHGDVLKANPTCMYTVDKAIKIQKKLKLRNIRAKLKDGVGLTAIFKVLAEGVVIQDFVLYGNKKTVSQPDRMSLILVFRSKCIIRRGVFVGATQNGVLVRPSENGKEIVGGRLEDLVGRGCMRDVVSISTRDAGKLKTRRIVVKNIKAYNSPKKGAVEVSDGAKNIRVENIYAEDCVYAIDIQDHNKGALEKNSRIRISNVHAKNSKYAIHSQTSDIGHSDIVISNVRAENCNQAIYLKNIGKLSIDGLDSIGGKGQGNGVELDNCNDLTLKHVKFGSKQGSSAVLLKNSSKITINDVVLNNGSGFNYGITFIATKSKNYRGLTIEDTDVTAARTIGLRILELAPKTELGGIKLSNLRGTIIPAII
ncbi:hypothetical protein NDN08_003315 [Rhodosorus marinus]|uniref:Right handed beta helix domain-containing protein n=1 Tax=Rhodosorus marinus TaxID=101924 RepID=A0AAV8UWA0_9RHOD|nr:hypothetical protein NDN08_003315 [Rhodosorus marinus]